jgi:hypothetical protein
MQLATSTVFDESASLIHISEHTLNILALLNSQELHELYKQGTVPQTFEAFGGTPKGRMLSLQGPPGRGLPGFILRQLSGSAFFPWDGKSFFAIDENHGMGINRVHLGAKMELFVFSTRIGPSLIDDKPTVILDYDRPENPFFIRAIHDEIREVAPDLWVGPAMLKRKTGAQTLLYFGLSNQ